MPYIAWLVVRYATMNLNFKSLAFSYIKTGNPEKYLNYIKRSQFLLHTNHIPVFITKANPFIVFRN